jgi:outer membrane receptor protein involved in Fe transport
LLSSDGVRVAGEQQSIVLDAGGQAPSRIDDISAEQIACVYVLRGPAATARYGTDAAGGIIHVITRRGSDASPRVSVFLDGGVANDVTDYPANFGTQSASASNGCSRAAAALGQCVAGPVRSWSPLSADSPFRSAPIVRGGVFASRPGPHLSLGVGGHAGRETGVLVNNEQTQYGANATGQWRQGTALRFESDLWYMGGRASLPQVGGLSLSILNSALLGASIDDPIRRGYRTVPLSVLKEFGTDQSYQRLGGGVRSSWKLNSWLGARAALGYEDSRVNDEQFDPQVLLTQPPTVNPPRVLGKAELRAKRTSANAFLTAGYHNGGLEYTTEIGVDYLHEDQLEKTHVRDTGTPSFFESETFAPFDAKTTGVLFQQSLSASGDRFQVDAGVRHDFLDGTLDIANPTYPFASASWRPLSSHQHDMRRALASFRLRAAYGENGDTRPYRQALAGAVVAPPGTFPDPTAAKVERTREVEAGFDAGFFGERGVVHATYFTRWVSDALTEGLLPPGNGTSPVPIVRAVAKWRNRGIELSLRARPVEMPNVQGDVEVSFSRVKNEVTSLGDTPGFIAVSNRVQVGYPLFGAWAPDYTFTDQNSDGVIVPAEVIAGSPRFLGAPVPTREIGIAPSVTFRRALSFTALLDYRGGFRSFNQSGRLRCNINCAALYVADAPLAEQARAIDPNDALEAWVEDATFLKLREVTLSYALRRTARKGTTRLVFSGRNLWTHSNYTGLDPEVSQTGQSSISQFEFFTLPLPRSYSVRLDIAW